MQSEANKADRYQESRDIWKGYNDNQKFEHDLINRKATWSLTTQGLLFAAYGVTLNVEFGDAAVSRNIDTIIAFRRLVAFSGLIVALATLVGVAAVINSKWQSMLRYRDFYTKEPLNKSVSTRLRDDL